MTSMLEFISSHRTLIETRTRELCNARSVHKPSGKDTSEGIPILFDQLLDTLRRGDRESEIEIERVAGNYGGLLFTHDFTVGELVSAYGTVCEAVTTLGEELNAKFSNREFEMLNRVLDVAIAAAVTEYQRQGTDAHAHRELEHLGSLAHELRNALAGALMTFGVIRKGVVGPSGRTGDALERSLRRMGDLIDRALAEVRFRKDAVPIVEPLRLADVFDQIATMVASDVEARQQSLDFDVDHDLEVATDRQMLTSALSNLVQNGLRYTRKGGHVHVRAEKRDGHLAIEVEDECGGLPRGMTDKLFAPFARGTAHGPGMGLGLSIAVRASRTLGGDVHVHNEPGKGCRFTIDLPTVPTATTP